MSQNNVLETIPYKIDTAAMEAKINQLPNIDTLLRFAKNFSRYLQSGVITAPKCIKAMIHKKLEKLIEEKYNDTDGN